MNKSLLMTMLVSLMVFPRISAAKGELPAQIDDLHVGMSREDFMKARPALALKHRDDLKRANRPNGIFQEKFSTGDFDSAVYVFQKGKLAAITLYMTKEDSVPVNSRRQRIYKDCVAKWGQARKKVGKLRAGKEDVGEEASAATWSAAGKRSMMFAPRGKRAKSPKLLLTILASDTTETPAFEEGAASDVEQSAAFRETGLQD